MPEDRPQDTYRLGYRWRIDGPIEDVFDLLSHGATFPDWWKPVFQSAVPEDAGEPRVGSTVRYRVRSRLPYRLDWVVTVRRLEPPKLIETNTTVLLGGRFQLKGVVRFKLFERDGHVEVMNEQEMRADRRLPRPLRALAQRAFTYNHDWAMAIGGRGLQRAVTARVARAPASP